MLKMYPKQKKNNNNNNNIGIKASLNAEKA